jgi:putative membrane protein
MVGAASPPEADLARVRDAVRSAEATTSGEIFVVVARESDEYRAIPILWATLAALLAPLPLILLTLLPAGVIYGIQLLVFIALALFLSLPEIKPWVVPPTVAHAKARSLAVEQFLAHGLHTTEQRTGVLVFVSLAERHAEIIADAGIAAKVDQAAWDAAMEKLLAELRAGRLADGLVAAVNAVGAVLAEHFPPGALNRDELPDEVVVL